MGLMRDDVILREIRRLVDAILRLRRAREGERSLALGTLDGDLERIIGLPIALVDAMSDDTLRATLSPAGELDVARALALAAFLEARAEHARPAGGARAVSDRARAASLRDAASSSRHGASLDALDVELARLDGAPAAPS